MEQIENVIGQGNNFVREKKFAQAKEVYSEAIRLLSMVGDQSSEEVKQQYVRVFNNRAQACLSLKEYEQAIFDCNQVLNLDPLNEKAIIRLIQSIAPNNNVMAYKVLLDAMLRLPTNQKLVDLQKALFPDYINLTTLIGLGCEQTNKYIFSVKQLRSILHKPYHDTWQVEDYFDPKSEGKCFDIPCPPEKFIAHQESIQQEVTYFEELAKKNKGTLQPILDYSNVYCTIPKIATDTEFPISHQYYYKFSHGEKKPNGFANLAWIRSLFRLKANNKEIFIMLPSKSSGEWKLYRLSNFGLQFGNVRCKSVNWYAIHKGDVVVRDFDKHIWSRLILEEVDNTANQEELFIDFMAAQFNHFDYFTSLKLPCKIFTRESIKQYEDVYCEDYIGVYKIKDRTVMGLDARTFIERSFLSEFPLDEYPTRLLFKLDEAYKYELSQRNYIPKERRFI
ncbi:TPR repeat domain-containing protein [Naegleria gruberi]|uniref:TPR repeat domain-containing protein n=1 Tax=Naegleria gruberi TaxID=5762 RepID=D2VZQ8_NAEGR|nr:TPR repeat domain-containing protein [Naegleria gruberi]EFC37742.1 TPR repeat domain-containing protein [Naegleria gruberi]|eukprot:XP_002670486.1 TPR repeat domain-containing protein [Naegleria gruberi strain NEG-M]